SQDTDLAREKTDQGLVPAPEDITVEGLLNEHDLPLEGPPCERELCIGAAYAITPTLVEQRAAIYLQFGFSSGIDGATFRRSPLNLSVVVDRSGSMDGTKLWSVRTALNRLLDQLDERDRLSIVLFDDAVDLLVESTPVNDREAIRARIAEITARGATDMAAGLQRGFEQVSAYAGQQGVADRVMIFTDAMTNTGDTATTTFVELAAANAAKGIGLTVFGVGIDLNQDLVLAISKLRGGNYYFLEDSEKIASVFSVDFDYLVTPLAHDLRLVLKPQPGFHLGRVFGYSSCSSGCEGVEIDVKTVFLSQNRGAIVAQIDRAGVWPSGKPPIAKLELSYTRPSDGETVRETLDTQYDGAESLCDETMFYSHRAVRKTAALVNEALAMHRACDLYWNYQDPRTALKILQRAIELLLSEAEILDDSNLEDEAALVDQLADNIRNAADL
ncbi:MAG: VWA domain-containing protein, partial [Pseudomonadota bacterium]